MGLPFDLDLAFLPREIELARTFVDSGKAELTGEGEGGFFEAAVTCFGRRYFTWVRSREREVLGFGCDCVHFEETGTGCEHLKALLLLLDPPEAEPEPESSTPRGLEPTYLLLFVESWRRQVPLVDLRLPNGSPLALDHRAWAEIHDDAHIAAIRALAGAAGGWQDVRRGGGFLRPRGPYELDGEHGDRQIEMMAATGRLCFGHPDGTIVNRVEARGEDLDLYLEARPDGAGRAAWAGLVIAGGSRLPYESLTRRIPGPSPWILVGDRLHRLETHGAPAWARTLAKGPLPPVPMAEALAFLDGLGDEHGLPRIIAPGGETPVPLIERPPQGVVRASSKGRRRALRLGVRYGSGELDDVERRAELVFDPAAPSQSRRDFAAEHRLVEDFMAMGADPDADDHGLYWCDRDDWSKLLMALQARGFVVEVEGRRLVRSRPAPFRLTSGIDWFRLDGGLAIEGEAVPLARVLDAIEKGNDWVPLDGARAADLPWELREALASSLPLGRLGRSEDGGLRFDGPQAALVAALLPDSTRGAEAEDFVALKEKLRRASEIGGCQPPPLFKGRLRPYQLEGLGWMRFLDEAGLGGCLADEMGLGKTPQVIAELARRAEGSPKGPFLVVVPRSLVPNWKAELERFAPTLPVLVHSGGSRQVRSFRAGQVVLTTYGILLRDEEDLAGVEFEMVVLDEAQAIKTRSSRSAAAARRLRARSRLALTGTPIENDLDELWSIMEFLNPGLLGRSPGFASLMRQRGEEARTAIAQALRPFLLRRTKIEVALDLPELLEQTLFCDMTEEQGLRYAELARSARAAVESTEPGSRDPARVLEALLRLRQAACHGALVGAADAGSGKVELLVDRLLEAQRMRKKSVVFSQFTSLLDLVEGELDREKIRHVRLDGSTRDRETPVRRFQEDPEVDAFLISIRAGGVGLNLTAADYVFVLDPWWNPAVEAQAIARAHRIGRMGAVLAVRIVTRGSVEERMLDLQERKRELAESILSAAPGAGVERIDVEDLVALL